MPIRVTEIGTLYVDDLEVSIDPTLHLEWLELVDARYQLVWNGVSMRW